MEKHQQSARGQRSIRITSLSSTKPNGFNRVEGAQSSSAASHPAAKGKGATKQMRSAAAILPPVCSTSCSDVHQQSSTGEGKGGRFKQLWATALVHN